jgi:hypothetical protein|nr:BACON domain-containing protein [uncultured Capnocytophaga sp.]
MKKFTLLLLATSLVFCSKKDDNTSQNGNSSVVTPETTLLNVPAEQGNYSLKVTADGAYTEQTDATWIKLSPDTDYKTLKFEVLANDGGDRHGTINLMAQNSLKAKIDVYQKAFLYVTPATTTVEVGAQAGEHAITITDKNVNNYTLKASHDWITFPIQPNKNKIVFETKENTTGADRTATITIVVDGKNTVEIAVTQKVSISYTLPFVEFGKVIDDIKKFEEVRKSSLKSEKDLGSGSQLVYTINDKLFGEIQYVINLRGLQKAGIFAKENPITDAQKKSFEDFLVKEGFEKITIKGYKTTLDITPADKEAFVHREKQVLVQFMADAKANHYAFSYYPIQQKNFATFSQLPALFKKGATKDEIAAYEQTNGGTYDPDNSPQPKTNRDGYTYNVNKGNVLTRTYFVGKSTNTLVGLYQTTFRFNSASLAFFAGLDGEYYPTKEFLALLEKHGYSYSGISKGYYVFKNGKDIISAKALIENQETVLDFRVYYVK